MLHYIFYIISLVLLTILLLKINNYHLFDDALVFSVGTNYLLILSTFLFWQIRVPFSEAFSKYIYSINIQGKLPGQMTALQLFALLHNPSSSDTIVSQIG